MAVAHDTRAGTSSPASLTGRVRRLLAGGPAGNERLTSSTGAVLLVLLAVEGVTVVFLRPLLWVHLFVGMLLIGPVTLKLASTGYRFVRYYAGRLPYRRKGPPPWILRATAPGVVASTGALLGSGVALLLAGPAAKGTVLPIHKASFIVWLVFMGVHLVGHLGAIPAALKADYGPVLRRRAARPAGASGRHFGVGIALASGVALAVLTFPLFAAWLQSAGLHDG